MGKEMRVDQHSFYSQCYLCTLKRGQSLIACRRGVSVMGLRSADADV